MCRIAGIIDPTNVHLESDILKMRDAMHRGGPDDAGVYVHEGLALGHRRLSIIDLSAAGHQPMLSEDANLVLCYNGEIYNFKELRLELETAGYLFRTQTDSEVILKGFAHWGTDCFEKLNGMFALSIFDKKQNELTLARDQSGIKPLYVYQAQDILYFASEIRAFKALDGRFTERSEWKTYFLLFGHLPEPITTLNEVTPLPKGTYWRINLTSFETQKVAFHQPNTREDITSIHEAEQVVRTQLEQAVARHLIADAPIGLFLSGGIDSSLLTILSEPHLKDRLNTLSIVFDDEKYSEKRFQEIIIQQTGAKHQSFLVTKEQFTEALPDILEAMDQPSNDAINSYFICKYAKQYGLTAVLSGLGADEYFGGYQSFYRSSLIRLSKWIPSFVWQLFNYLPQDKYRKISFLAFKNGVGEYLFHRGLHNVNEVAKLLRVPVKELKACIEFIHQYHQNLPTSPFNRASYLESNFYMQNQLLKDTDYMSMWHSVEVRVPFLDKSLLKALSHISEKLKFSKTQPKSLLIAAFQKQLPEAIWNRPKQGFTFPFSSWLKHIKFASTSPERQAYALKQFNKGNYSWSRHWVVELSEVWK